MMFDILLLITIAGVGIAILASIMGCFVVWNNMAYFSDSLAHSTLFGVALGLLLHIDMASVVIAVSIVFALLLFALGQQKALAFDTILGVLAYTFLALGVISLSLFGTMVDLHSYLFGDILAISLEDIYRIYALLIVVVVGMKIFWQQLVLMVINPSIAKVEGVPVMGLQLGFAILLAILVAMSVELVGALLIGALLIIPTSSARLLSRSPLQMMGIGIGLSIVAMILGVYASFVWDTPTGPMIVAMNAVLFFVIFIIHSLFSITDKK